jgi:hypothetical protein
MMDKDNLYQISYLIAERHFNNCLDAEVQKSFGLLKTEKMRKAILKTINYLRLLEGYGLVETTKGLPHPGDIISFDIVDLSELRMELQERYFPHKQQQFSAYSGKSQ